MTLPGCARFSPVFRGNSRSVSSTANSLVRNREFGVRAEPTGFGSHPRFQTSKLSDSFLFDCPRVNSGLGSHPEPQPSKHSESLVYYGRRINCGLLPSLNRDHSCGHHVFLSGIASVWQTEELKFGLTAPAPSRQGERDYRGTVFRSPAGSVRAMLGGMADVTQILDAIEAGDASAAAELLPLVYDELRKLAASRLADEKPGQTLQPTALVHEAYVRLVGGEEPQDWNGRGHFFAAAAEAMRRILLDVARRKGRRKRGGGMVRRDLTGIDPAAPADSDDLLAIDEALSRLAVADAQAAELVRLKFYAGLPIPEIARILGISPRTADRVWAYARSWLHQD